MASPRLMPLSLQYSLSFDSVSASKRIVTLTALGFSAFGRPVRGLKSSPHFLHYIYSNLRIAKSQEVFQKTLHLFLYVLFYEATGGVNMRNFVKKYLDRWFIGAIFVLYMQFVLRFLEIYRDRDLRDFLIGSSDRAFLLVLYF